MAWRETCRMGERLSFVRSCEAGEESVSELCRRYGVSRKTGYKWLARYRAFGAEGLFDRSRAAHKHPNAVTSSVCQTVLAVRYEHPRWGPKKIKAWLERRVPEEHWPAASTIGRILEREGIVGARRRRRRTVTYDLPFEACRAANDVWCMDFKGWFLTGDGTRVDPFTLSDGHSRYLLACQAVGRADLSHVWQVLEGAFRAYGLPKAIRSDNGPPFGSTAPGGLSRLGVRLIKAGVMPERIRPGHPEENGRHERMHLTLKQETASPPARSLQAQIERFAAFQLSYNHERPHEALGQTPPASHYQHSPRVWDGCSREPDYGSEFVVRRVRTNGQIKWRGARVFISEVLIGERVALSDAGAEGWRVFYGPVALGVIDRDQRLKRYTRPMDMMDKPSGLPTSPQANNRKNSSIDHEHNRKTVTHAPG